MIDYPTLSYTATCEIPALLHTKSPRKVPLSDEGSPKRQLQGVSPGGHTLNAAFFYSFEIRYFQSDTFPSTVPTKTIKNAQRLLARTRTFENTVLSGDIYVNIVRE